MTARFTIHDLAWLLGIALVAALWIGGCATAHAQEPRVTTWTVSIVVPKPSTAVLTPGEILLRFTAMGESISGQQLAEAIIKEAVKPVTFKGQALYRSVTLQAAERCRKVEEFTPDGVFQDADWKADGLGWESTIKPTPLGAGVGVKVTVKGESSWWVEVAKPLDDLDVKDLNDLELGTKK